MNDKLIDKRYFALSSGFRRSILDRLSKGPTTILLLSQELNVSLPAIHRHLKALEDAKLLVRTKYGRDTYVDIDSEGLRKLSREHADTSSKWISQSSALKEFFKS